MKKLIIPYAGIEVLEAFKDLKTSDYNKIVFLGKSIDKKEVIRFYLNRITFYHKVEFLEKDFNNLFEFIQKFKKELIGDKDVLIYGKINEMHLYLFYLGVLNITEIDYFIFYVSNKLFKVKNDFFDVHKLLDNDDIKIIENLDYISSMKRKDIVEFLYEEYKISRAKTDKELKRLSDLGIIEKINTGEYKLSKLGYAIKLLLRYPYV